MGKRLAGGARRSSRGHGVGPLEASGSPGRSAPPGAGGVFHAGLVDGEAVGSGDEPQAALDTIAGLRLDDYYLFHAVRADLLRRADRPAEAAAAYEVALGKCGNVAEREFLSGRLQSLTST